MAKGKAEVYVFQEENFLSSPPPSGHLLVKLLLG